MEPTYSLSCDELPAWRSAKLAAIHLGVVFSPYFANVSKSYGGIATYSALAKLDNAYRTSPEGCPLGVRTLSILRQLGDRSVDPSDDFDVLSSKSPWSLEEIIDSGWPVFSLIHSHTFDVLHANAKVAEVRQLDESCHQFELHAQQVFPSTSIERPDVFYNLMIKSLVLRPKRRNLPVELLRAFRDNVRAYKMPCFSLIAAGEVALAFSLAQEQELRNLPLRKISSLAVEHLEHAQHTLRKFLDILDADLPGNNLARIVLLTRCPIFGMLQGIQDLIHQFHPGIGNSGVEYGFDRWPIMWHQLRHKSPSFWEERRKQLRKAVFGSSGHPDTIGAPRIERMDGTIIESPSPDDNMFVLIWNLGRLNSTGVVFRARDHLFSGVGVRRIRSNGLVIYHIGHNCVEYGFEHTSLWDTHGYAALFTSLGFDVLALSLPFHAFNRNAEVSCNQPNTHDVFFDWYWNGDDTVLSYFATPVVLSLDWAETHLGHTRFAMVGNSGGGVVTTLAAALDPRISFSISWGSVLLPPHLVDWFDWHDLYDFEYKHHALKVCSWLCMYTLSTIGSKSPRWAVHIHHDDYAFGIEDELKTYFEQELPRVLAAAAGSPHESETMNMYFEKELLIVHAAASGLQLQTRNARLMDAPLRLVIHSTDHHTSGYKDKALMAEMIRCWASGSRPPTAVLDDSKCLNLATDAHQCCKL
eukprot:TRINITY_DN65944_c0_g1_i1.p1 TRINITY_DN65944_c0_g1~~TRINITY_DN65944_c0_g1_i1.p1  ORF type:complete len:706 (+),score=37.48 TRINITY_DN65944_c0_g1_i1:33-2120(+)